MKDIAAYQSESSGRTPGWAVVGVPCIRAEAERAGFVQSESKWEKNLTVPLPYARIQRRQAQDFSQRLIVKG